MCPKASSDFGLYKEKLKDNNFTVVKFVAVLTASTVFFMAILYALLHLVENDSQTDNYESSVEKPRAERLVRSQSTKREISTSTPPKPFGLTYRGHPPAKFTPPDFTTENTRPASLSFPQIRYYPYRYFPKNIQEVIAFTNNPAQTEAHDRYRKPKTSSSDLIPQNQRSAKRYTNDNHDPFYLYKPQDPGEINLMATRDYRFAPLPWSRAHNFKNFKQSKLTSPTLNYLPYEENKIQAEQREDLRNWLSRVENYRSDPDEVVFPFNFFSDHANKFYAPRLMSGK